MQLATWMVHANRLQKRFLNSVELWKRALKVYILCKKLEKQTDVHYTACVKHCQCIEKRPVKMYFSTIFLAKISIFKIERIFNAFANPQ